MFAQGSATRAVPFHTQKNVYKGTEQGGKTLKRQKKIPVRGGKIPPKNNNSTYVFIILTRKEKKKAE